MSDFSKKQNQNTFGDWKHLLQQYKHVGDHL